MKIKLNLKRFVPNRRALVLIGSIGLFLFSVSRILQSHATVLPQAAAAAAANVEARTTAAEPATRLVAIDQLQVGQRVRADAPTDELDLQFGSEIVSEDWRKLTLLAPKRDGSTADVVLIRPLTWLNGQQAEVGGTVFISVPECGIDGHAQVLAIEPCPEILLGDGRVITGTFRHQVSASISLSIARQQEPILCTGNHPFWSEDRHDFVRADSLQPNETLRTTSGSTTVTSLTHVPGSTAVYNLEIHGTHVYHVGSSGVLVHNGDECLEAIAKSFFGDGPREAAFGMKSGLPWLSRAFPDAKNFADLGLDPLAADFAAKLEQVMRSADKIRFNASGMRGLTGADGVLTGPAHLNILGSTNWELRTIFDNPELRRKTLIYIDGVLKTFDDLLRQ